MKGKIVVLLSLGFIASLSSLLLSDLSDGGADAIVHFGMAQGCWKHPVLLLDLWGKPLFTLLSSPFAQLGFKGHQFFNVIIAAITAFYSWKTAKTIGIKNPWLVIPFLWSFPVWFPLTFSSMTEPLFSCMLIAGIYFYLNNKELSAALIISFLPFSRQEGIAFLVLFLILFLFRKKIKPALILFSAPLMFTGIGWLVFKDPLWLVHRQPYQMDHPYAPGSFFHYVTHYDGLFGLVGSILLLAGTLWFLWRMREGRVDRFVLLAGGFWTIFFAHSLIYYQGKTGAIGLLRLLATVAPLAAVLVAAGCELISARIKNVKLSLVIGILFLIVQTAFVIRPSSFVLRNGPLEKALKDFANTIPEKERKERTIYSTDPQLWFYLERDYWDEEKWIRVNHKGHYQTIKDPSLFIVDGMFGNWLDREELEQREGMELINTFVPKDDFSFGREPYRIYVFEMRKESL